MQEMEFGVTEKVAVLLPGAIGPAGPVQLQQWLVAAGDEVHEGERIAEATIPGILISIVCPCAGRLSEIVAPVMTRVEPSQVLAWIVPDPENEKTPSEGSAPDGVP